MNQDHAQTAHLCTFVHVGCFRGGVSFAQIAPPTPLGGGVHVCATPRAPCNFVRLNEPEDETVQEHYDALLDEIGTRVSFDKKTGERYTEPNFDNLYHPGYSGLKTIDARDLLGLFDALERQNQK